ncbi:AbrB family transcriptional regulator [Halanaerobiaceae bacterium Z-7014]|uniref:AbrB family transcriptional regulator n=1 Tax=Halonatronomonas betaini TaxID=2778430 RepID=A0A931F617_9FIRM|nr:AbrB/MazE/SpoVT family DNA-binding domain-containing protein [Halonatronomonas betaini]MBF8436435.1 AbrB family transcriptional regulator [Halonatronomonas betaini]
MKSTGIVREVDNLGRLVLPKELRTTMKLDFNDPMEFYKDGDNIILRKFNSGCSGCHFCGSMENRTFFKGKFVCESCIEELKD